MRQVLGNCDENSLLHEDKCKIFVLNLLEIQIGKQIIMFIIMCYINSTKEEMVKFIRVGG